MNMQLMAGSPDAVFPSIYGDFCGRFHVRDPLAFINYYPRQAAGQPDPRGRRLASLPRAIICLLVFALGIGLWRRGVQRASTDREEEVTSGAWQ
jgi:hypothetical protein